MWVRMGPSDENRQDSIADPMTLGHYKDSMAKGESKVEGQTGSNVKSTLIEKEMKQLEKIKFKQVSLP